MICSILCKQTALFSYPPLFVKEWILIIQHDMKVYLMHLKYYLCLFQICLLSHCCKIMHEVEKCYHNSKKSKDHRGLILFFEALGIDSERFFSWRLFIEDILLPKKLIKLFGWDGAVLSLRSLWIDVFTKWQNDVNQAALDIGIHVVDNLTKN